MEQQYTNYIGPSMNPLLVDGDGLHIVPYKDRAIRPGDVVVFLPPGSETKIVHRIVSVDAKGIRTRGDNANTVDPWVLTPDNILGRVTYIQRKNRRRSIAGGSMGRMKAFPFRCTRLFDAVVSFLLRPFYYRLCRLASLRKILHGILKPRVLSFGRPEGIELQLVAGHWLIGRCLPGKQHWEIKRPFRLCVDAELLPRPTPTEVTVTQWPVVDFPNIENVLPLEPYLLPKASLRTRHEPTQASTIFSRLCRNDRPCTNRL